MAKIKKNPYLPKENVCIPCIKNVALEGCFANTNL